MLLHKPVPLCRSLLLVTLLIRTSQCIPLLRHTFLSPLARSLGLVALGLHLLLQNTLTLLLGLGLVDLRAAQVSELKSEIFERQDLRVRPRHAYA